MPYGILNLKTLLEFVFKSLNAGLTIDKNNDGKASFAEIVATITPLAFQFPKLYEAFPFLKEEYKDLTEEELGELIEYIDELDLPVKYDNLEEIIKLTVKMLHYNYKYVVKMKELL
jgi:hypothetical protein